ncbi:unnamed protein product [Choristocarpus tenellus]
MCKYIRREIRTLTEDDRQELFDSVSLSVCQQNCLTYSAPC